MLVKIALLLGLMPWIASPVRAEPAETAHLAYNVYAAGLHVAEVETSFGVGSLTYQLDLAYHTTGLVGFFYHGHHQLH